VILAGLIKALSRASTYSSALERADRSTDFSVVDGLRVPLLAGLLARRSGPQAMLVVTATGRESEAVRLSLSSYVPEAEVIEFPAWETLPHERLSPSAETVGKRIHALRRLAAWSAEADAATASGASAPVRPLVVVAGVRAALQPVSDNLADIDPVVLTAGDRGHDLSAIATHLVDLAYARDDMVTRRGEFAVRGA
jgi:transcription-repair coupling factor (superfamily II helicase)